MILPSARCDLYQVTLRQNFALMGVGFVGKLNQNFVRNTGAELYGTDRIRHQHDSMVLVLDAKLLSLFKWLSIHFDINYETK